MGRLENEARTAMTVLLKQGHSQSAVARMLGVSEGTVRYHRRRSAAGAVDGRTTQVGKAAAVAEAIAHWRNQQPAGRVRARSGRVGSSLGGRVWCYPGSRADRRTARRAFGSVAPDRGSGTIGAGSIGTDGLKAQLDRRAVGPLPFGTRMDTT